ncbi:MAG: hypothetical protein KDC38_03045 [Planctomycetes bacterium]|nr:hypothetical protein [Planctomycetota bacterium]
MTVLLCGWVTTAQAQVTFLAYHWNANPSELVTFTSDDPGSVTVIGSCGSIGLHLSGLEVVGGEVLAYGELSDDPVGLFRVNTVDGSVSLLGGGGVASNSRITDLAFNPAAGQLFASAFNSRLGSAELYQIDTSNGYAFLVEDFGAAGIVPVGLAYDGCGRGFLHDIDTERMYEICGSDLRPMPLGTGTMTNHSQGMTIDWDGGGSWYQAIYDNSLLPSYLRPQLRSVDPLTGETTLIGVIGAGVPGQPSYPCSDLVILPTIGNQSCLPFVDCDGDGQADLCATVSSAPDCNRNMVPDVCDIADGTSTDVDADGIPDECRPPFSRGDCNTDALADIADVVAILTYVTGGSSSAPGCLDACDSNDDGVVDIADSIASLSSLFGAPTWPLPPPSSCGQDPTSDGLDCGSLSPCP